MQRSSKYNKQRPNCFLKGRYIGENILRLTRLMDYLDETNEPALLLSVDFEKAFDCLELPSTF